MNWKFLHEWPWSLIFYHLHSDCLHFLFWALTKVAFPSTFLPLQTSMTVLASELKLSTKWLTRPKGVVVCECVCGYTVYTRFYHCDVSWPTVFLLLQSAETETSFTTSSEVWRPLEITKSKLSVDVWTFLCAGRAQRGGESNNSRNGQMQK